jgi:DNA-binding NarL/FixJ family response regulator
MASLMNQRKNETRISIPKTIKVALVDDQQLFRAGINSLLKEYDDFNVMLEATNGKDFIDQLKRHKPHVVLLDIEMPEMNGIDTTVFLNANYPEIKIIILTMHNEEEFVFDLISKGAHGFLPKDRSVEEVANAIYSVIDKGKYYNDEITDIMVKGSKGLLKDLQLKSLNEREIEIIKMICKQKTTKEMADALNISVRTMENYRTAILDKTDAKNLAGVVLYALKNKIISRIEML